MSCPQVWSPQRHPQQSEVLREPLQDSDLLKFRGGLANTSPPWQHSQVPAPALALTAQLFRFSHAQLASWPPPTLFPPPRSRLSGPSKPIPLAGEFPLLQGKPGLGAQKGLSCLPTTRAPPPLHAIAEMTYFHVYPTVGGRPCQQGPVCLNE